MTDYLVISMDDCPWCDKAKAALTEAGKSYGEVNLTMHPEAFRVMQAISAKTVPQVLKVVGGFEATVGDLG